MQNIQSIINSSIEKLYSSNYTPEITIAPKSELGEYCINIFPIAKTAGKAPQIIAEEVANALAKYSDIFASTSATGGYVNFFLTNSVWIKIFQSINTTKKNSNNETIVVDYIWANVGKPLHIGHICTPSIGQTVCNIYNHLGYRVIGDSHFGDWGGIFGKLICLWKISPNNYDNLSIEDKYTYTNLSKIFNETDWSKASIEQINELEFFKKNNIDTIKEYDYAMLTRYFFATYVVITFIASENPEIDEQCRIEFKKLSEWNVENAKIWQKYTWASIFASQGQLRTLNIGWENKKSVYSKFYNIGESFYEGIGLPRPNNEDYPDLEYTMKDIVAELIEKWVATQNEDGSVGVIFPEETKMPSCILQKKDGTGLYLTSDLAAIKYRLTNGWNPSKIIYSVDVRQQLHLKQAFWIAKQAWGKELWADTIEFYHAFNGFIKLKEGAMSTRHGTVIFLEKLIEEGFEKTKSILEEKWRTLSDTDIQAITIAAIKYSYLAQDREKDVTFDWDKALNFEGNSGPYIQYAFVRAKKIYSEGEISVIGENITLSAFDKSLIKTLAEMESIIEQVAITYKPHHLALYAYRLATEFNSFYVHTPKILEEKDENLKNFRLTLVKQTTNQLELAFDLLGIKMPTEM